MSSRYVALLRGINVGGNKKVPMPVLRAIVEEKYSDVSTLINSGNVVFTADTAPDAAWLKSRIKDETGVDAAVLMLSGAQLRSIAEKMPYDGDPAKIAVMFMEKVPTGIPIPEDLAPELIDFGQHAVYQWLPNGFSGTTLKPSFWKQFPPETTGRNWNTVQKLLALL